MHVLVCEKNLLWAIRLQNGIRSLGNQTTAFTTPLPIDENYDLAIINLSLPEFLEPTWLASLRENCKVLVAHAGHKEKELMEIGKSVGMDHLVTNGYLAKKLDAVLELARSESADPTLHDCPE